MEKKTLKNLFSVNLFRIPNYQRGYAWDVKQWNDFIEDIDALVNKDVQNHYTGTLVTYQDKRRPSDSVWSDEVRDHLNTRCSGLIAALAASGPTP